MCMHSLWHKFFLIQAGERLMLKGRICPNIIHAMIATYAPFFLPADGHPEREVAVVGRTPDERQRVRRASSRAKCFTLSIPGWIE